MSDEEYSNGYDTIGGPGTYEVPDLVEYDEVPDSPGDGENPDLAGDDEVPGQSGYDEVLFNHDVYKNLGPEHTLSTAELHDCDYASVGVYTIRGEKNGFLSSQPEAGDYLMSDEVCAEPQDGNISMHELLSPAQDLELHLAQPLEDSSTGKEALLSPSSFTILHSRDFPSSWYPICHSGNDSLDGKEASLGSPEIFLFVKVSLPLVAHGTCRRHN